MSIARDSLITFSTRVAIFVLQGTVALLLARILGPEGRGIYALIITVPHIAAMLCNFGLSVSSAYFVSSGKIDRERLLAWLILFPLATSVVAIGVLFLFSSSYTRIYPEVPLGLFQFSLFLIPVIAYFNNGLSFLQGQKRFYPFNFVNLFNPFVFLVSFSVLVPGWRLHLLGTVLSWQVGFLSSVACAAYFIGKTTRPDFTIRWSDFALISRYSSRISAAEILTFLNYRLDIFLVGYFLDARFVGWYTIAVILAETLWYLSMSIGSVLLPNFSQRSTEEAQKLLRKAFSFVFWLTLVMVSFLVLLDRRIILFIFGKEFLYSVKALRFLYPGILLFSLYRILTSYIASRNRPGVIMNIAFAGVLSNLLFNLIFIPGLGIRGAALASSLSYGLMFFSGLIWFSRQRLVSISSLFVIRKKEFAEIFAWYSKWMVQIRTPAG